MKPFIAYPKLMLLSLSLLCCGPCFRSYHQPYAGEEQPARGTDTMQRDNRSFPEHPEPSTPQPEDADSTR